MDITSIVVPSVQELAKEQLTVVPDQYVIQDQETVVLSSLQVPVLDLGKLLSEDLNLKGQELKRLDYACKEWGFFQV
ncbi:protein SRG1-like [Trifolium pratense]|uniref:Protein SRG1-like n=1 Tax=Trifolium pratense TaxID=57577 RepID=A0A2K3K7U5_TRIPR|nr:protein SRG1-like [Trifolium pratense]